MKRRIIFIFIIFFCEILNINAQVNKTDSLTLRADSLHNNYFFEEAIEVYNDILDGAEDTIIMQGVEQRLMLSENGRNMMGFCSVPKVVAKQIFSLDEFFLFYPLEDKSWRSLPNQLDSTEKGGFVSATYVQASDDFIYYSASDSDGIRNIYKTEFKDTIWTAPELVNESVISASDEIFPVISPDKKSMYFSSKGLYGVGGYDLYVATWDEEKNDWGVPVNMGFPYSSPANDLLFVDTKDGKYSIFASDRNAPKDSIHVYVLEFDNMPIRKKVDTVDELKNIMNLDPDQDLGRIDNNVAEKSLMPESADIKEYAKKVAELKALRDSIYLQTELLETARTNYTTVEDSDKRADLTAEILEREAMLPALQDSLKRCSTELQEIEMEFLFSGVVLDPQALLKEADREVVGASSSFVFTQMSMGDSLDLKMAEPIKEFDYTFMILPEARVVEDNLLPEGLVYQIQLVTLSRKATIAQLRGLSPVFENKTASGKYIYKVGLFRTYQDVLSNLNKVKRAGFNTAFITASYNSEAVTLQKARVIEKTKFYVYEVNIFHNEESLPEMAIKAISSATQKDISKVVKSGSTVFVVGPISNEEEALKVEQALKAVGMENISLEKIEVKKN